MHISLSWNGATGRTSYWTKRVAPTDYGPCRPRDLNWAYRYAGVRLLPCLSLPRVLAGATASATKKALVTYSGAAVHAGSGGPAVSAVQRGLRITQTAVYDKRTVAAVTAFQSRHPGCPVTGAMNPTTWRALLAAVR
jgi:peptidoglycan hydrolase-like protein with peptidoglycan-binding domain